MIWKKAIPFALLFLLASAVFARPGAGQSCCTPESLVVIGQESRFLGVQGKDASTQRMREPVRWTGIPVGMWQGRDIELIGRPDVWYNRVEALRLGLLFGMLVDDRLYLTAGGSVNTGLTGVERWSYRASARYYFGEAERTFASLSYHNGVHTRYESSLYGPFINSFFRLFGGDDYFDYYRSGRLRAVVGHELPDQALTAAVTLLNEDSRSVSTTTEFDVIGSNRDLRDNLFIEDLTIRSLGAYLWWGEPPFRPRGLFGEQRIALGVEWSSPGLLGSDKHFVRYTADIEWRLETLQRDEMRPNTLDLRLSAGTYSGELPRQRYGIVEGALGLYTPFGALRTLRGHPYEGDQYLAFFWEHHFRSLVFEQIGFDWAVEQGLGLALFGGHGRTWAYFDPQLELSDPVRLPDEFHHEVGVSVTGIFSVLRLDSAVRLDKPGWGLGLAISRVF